MESIPFQHNGTAYTVSTGFGEEVIINNTTEGTYQVFDVVDAPYEFDHKGMIALAIDLLS